VFRSVKQGVEAAHAAHMLHGRFLVKILGFTLDDVQGVLWAMPDAGSEPVTKHIPHDLGLAVDDGQSTLGAAGHALAAARALFFFYLNNFSFHFFLRWLLRESCLGDLG
jgi:hypothetical protein